MRKAGLGSVISLKPFIKFLWWSSRPCGIRLLISKILAMIWVSSLNPFLLWGMYAASNGRRRGSSYSLQAFKSSVRVTRGMGGILFHQRGSRMVRADWDCRSWMPPIVNLETALLKPHLSAISAAFFVDGSIVSWCNTNSSYRCNSPLCIAFPSTRLTSTTYTLSLCSFPRPSIHLSTHLFSLLW